MHASPNPFGRQTQLTYTLPSPGFVRLSIHDAQGRLVNQLVGRFEPAGQHAVRWSGRNEAGALMPSGIYHARLWYGDHTSTSTILLLR
jgi:flagellar hook assembly protein FlgD